MNELETAEQLVEDVKVFMHSSDSLTHSKCCLKLLRKIQADVDYLRKHISKFCSKGGKSSCNFAYLSGVFNETKMSTEVTEVLYDCRKYGLIIDLICDNGRTWKKIVARNPHSLHLIWAGQGQYGTKDIVAKLEQYLECSKKQCEFSPPAICVVFCNGITHEMAQHIEIYELLEAMASESRTWFQRMGIEVHGERVDVSQDVIDKLKSIVFDESSTEEDNDDADNDDYGSDSEEESSDSQKNYRNDSISIHKEATNSNAEGNIEGLKPIHTSLDQTSNQTNSSISSSKEFEDSITSNTNPDSKDSRSSPKEISRSDDIDEEVENLYKHIRCLKAEEKVFLDITTMLVYVCDICHGGSNFQLNDWVLHKQCTQEREKSALEAISPFIEGRQLLTCQSALEDYKSIVDMLGGPEERRRADSLIERLTVVPDRLSQRYLSLSSSGHIKDRSKVIFGTADYLKCPILTSNEGFIRGALAQGIHVPAIIHQPRALSEQKRLKLDNLQI